MNGDQQAILELCNKVHDIMQHATKNLPIPAPEKARDIRKKISVFTYGVITELTVQVELNKDKVYEQYLIMGGLSIDQANAIVRRTQEEFARREFGEICLMAGKNTVIQWLSGDKDIQPLISALL